MKLKSLVGICCILLSDYGIAEPTSGPVKIAQIRPYISGDIYLHLEANTDICPMSVYRIPADAKGANQMYSLALAAFLADKPIKIEIPSANVCPWGQAVQSIYIVK